MIERVYRSFDNRQDRDRAAQDLQEAGFDVQTFGMPAFAGSGATYEVSGQKDIEVEDFPTCAYSHGYTEQGDRLDSPAVVVSEVTEENEEVWAALQPPKGKDELDNPGLAAYVEDQLAAG